MSLIMVSAFSDGYHRVAGGKWDTVPSWAETTTSTLLRWPGEPVSNLDQNITGIHRRKIIPAALEDDLLIVGMAFLHPSSVFAGDGDGNNAGLTFASDGGATTHDTLTVVAGGAFRVRRGGAAGTILGTSPNGVIIANTWQYVEMKIRLHDTTGTVEVKVDGDVVINLTGQDTKNAGTKTVFDSVQWGRFGFQTYMTDIYIANEMGSVNNDFLGDMRVRTYFPDTEGGLTDWTPSTGADNSDTIDEVTVPPNTTDYNSSATPGQIDRFNMGATGLDPATLIHGVQVVSFAAKSDAGARSFRHNILSDASVATGPDKNLSTTFAPHLDVFESDPDGSVPWTQAQLDAAEIGYEARA